MKKLAVSSFVLLFAVSSQAQIKTAYERVKQAVTGSAQLSQLHYFPQAWETDLTVGFRLQKLEAKIKSPTATVTDAKQDISTVDTSIRLGLSDSLYAQIEWEYLIAMDVDYSVPVQESTKSTGAAEPLLSVVYRLVNADSFKLDTKAGYQPSLGDQKDADENNDGNALIGGQSFVVGAKAIALITGSSQVAANVVLKKFADATTVDQTTNQSSETEAHNRLDIELSTLTKLTSEMFFGLQLDIIKIDGYDRRSSTTTEVGTTEYKVLNLIGKYELNPDNLITVEAGHILNFRGEVLGLDFNTEGYSVALAYSVRF